MKAAKKIPKMVVSSWDSNPGPKNTQNVCLKFYQLINVVDFTRMH